MKESFASSPPCFPHFVSPFQQSFSPNLQFHPTNLEALLATIDTSLQVSNSLVRYDTLGKPTLFTVDSPSPHRPCHILCFRAAVWF